MQLAQSTQPGFGLFLFGHIAGGGVENAIRRRGAFPVQPAIAPILASEAALEIDDGKSLDDPPHLRVGRGDILGVNEIEERAGEEFRRTEAERLGESGIYDLEIPIGPRDAEHVERSGEKRLLLDARFFEEEILSPQADQVHDLSREGRERFPLVVGEFVWGGGR